MRKIAVVGVLALILGGAAYYAVFFGPSREFRNHLDEAIRAMPPGAIVSYSGASYSPLSRTATITGLSLVVAGQKNTTISVAELSIADPNLEFAERWKEAAATPATLAPDQALPLASEVALRGVSMQSALAEAKLASLTIEKPRLYPWALLHPGLPRLDQIPAVAANTLQAMGEASRERSAAAQRHEAISLPQLKALMHRQIDAMMPLVKLQAAALLGTGADAIDFYDVNYTFRTPNAPGAAGAEFSVSMAKGHEGPFERGEISEISGEGVTESAAPLMTLSIVRVAERKLSGRAPLSRILEGAPFSISVLDGASVGAMELDGLTMTSKAGPNIEFNRASMSDVSFDHGMLDSVAFAFDGYHLSRSTMADPNAELGFLRLGLDRITTSFDISYKWNTAKAIAQIPAATLKIDELGSLTMKADIGGIDPGKSDQELAPTLVGGSLRYVDGSLIDRALGAGGTRTAAQTAQIRQLFAAQMAKNAGLDQQANPTLAPALQAIADFAKEPHSLTVTAAPPSPVRFADIKAIAASGWPALFATLGLSVAANQRP
jgi:hypothetical protein